MLLNWAIPEKIRTGGAEDILFWKTPSGIFRFVTLLLEIPDKMKFHPWNFHQIVSHQLRFPRPKTKTYGNSTLFFSWSWLEIPILFLLTPGVCRFYFFNPPGNNMSSTPLPPHSLFFSGKALEVVTASQTKICKLFIQQGTRFGQRAQTILFNFRSGFMSALTTLQ